jgi:hypothetical protein
MRKGSRPVDSLSLAVPTEKDFDSTVKEILQRAEYKHLKNGFRDVIDKIKETISEWTWRLLEKTFSSLPSPSSISNKVSMVFVIIGILILLAIIVVVVVKLSKTLERRNRVKEILGEKIDERTTPNSLRSKASVFEKEGDYRLAIRFDFIALLLLMHEKNLVYLDETKTNEEIYNYLRKEGFEARSLYKYLGGNFNSSWYGHKLLSKDSYSAWSNSLNSLWNEVINYEAKIK